MFRVSDTRIRAISHFPITVCQKTDHENDRQLVQLDGGGGAIWNYDKEGLSHMCPVLMCICENRNLFHD